MAELKEDEVFKLKMMDTREFAELHNISLTAVVYLIKKGIIDCIKVADRYIVVLTKKTKDYTPRNDGRRQEVVKIVTNE